MQVPFMISCRKAAELTEKKLAGELGWTDNMRLLLHRAMCDACHRYGRQSQTLDQLLKRKTEGMPPSAKDATPDKALEDKILDKLKDL